MTSSQEVGHDRGRVNRRTVHTEQPSGSCCGHGRCADRRHGRLSDGSVHRRPEWGSRGNAEQYRGERRRGADHGSGRDRVGTARDRGCGRCRCGEPLPTVGGLRRCVRGTSAAAAGRADDSERGDPARPSHPVSRRRLSGVRRPARMEAGRMVQPDRQPEDQHRRAGFGQPGRWRLVRRAARSPLDQHLRLRLRRGLATVRCQPCRSSPTSRW